MGRAEGVARLARAKRALVEAIEKTNGALIGICAVHSSSQVGRQHATRSVG
jgi:hypothetical protein